MTRWIDLSHPVHDGMPVYPGDDPTRLSPARQMAADGYNALRLETGMHAGTHLDAPLHLVPGGKFIDDYPLEAFTGTGCLLNVRDEPVIVMKPEYESGIPADSIVLLRTGWDRNYGTPDYYENHPVVDPELARHLVAKRVKILGVDAPSPDRSPFVVHKLLLGNGVLILENLTNLGQLPPDGFEIFAFPLKIRAEGSLLRVAARIW